jgi:acetate---CoA ligase (ADP-forming)
VMVSAGGVLIETLRDRLLAPPPLDEARARRLIERLEARPLLGGVRGRPASDVTALALCMARLSLLAHDLGDLFGALDVNPIVVSPQGCLAVDALVEPRDREALPAAPD